MIYEDVFKTWLPDDEYKEYLEYRSDDTIQPRTIDSNPYGSDD